MKRALVLLVAACVVMGMATLATAAGPRPTNKQAAIAVHVGPWTGPGNCNPGPLTGSTVNPNGPLGVAQTAYFLVCNASDSLGIAGMEFGISFPPQIAVGQPKACGDLDFPQNGWPATGSGILVTWDRITHCKNTNSEPFVPGTVLVIGASMYVYAYGPGQLSVTPGPVSGRAKVADCRAAETDITAAFPSHLGTAGFGGAPSYNPCNGPTPVKETTWGKIKNQY
jgi:hypothetical protein